MVITLVAAAILILLVVDTIITAFLLGKYRAIYKEVRALASGSAPQTQAQTIDAVDLQTVLSALTGGKDA